MNVSHFELIFKPQSPVPPADTVLQGYFLDISNLENVDLSFRLEFVTSAISANTRTLANNTIVIVDVAGSNNDFSVTLVGGRSAKRFRLSELITIPAHATAKIAVLPNDAFPEPIGDGTDDPADYEARGYVNLRLPALSNGSINQLFVTPQLDRPAKVLLTAQNRATYFNAEGEIESQTQASLPLANGGALTEIEAETRVILDPVIIDDFDFEFARIEERIDFREVPTMLAELMAIAASAEIDTRAFNAALKEAGIGMALERRRLPDAVTTARVVEDA